MEETIRCTREGAVLTITLNRPDRLNAYTERMREELIDALDRADADDAVHAIVVTGEGRAFCAGVDMADGAETFNFDRLGLADPEHEWRDGAGLLARRIRRLLKPIVAAINGPAIGVGITMTLPMDIRLIAEDAVVRFPFTRLGIVPEASSTYFLPRIVGFSTAMEWCATGRMLGAEAVRAGGLVRSVHPAAELLPAARALAEEMAAGAPVSIAMMRQMFQAMLEGGDPAAAHLLESRVIYHRGRSADAREGITSFAEKRAPEYRDRVSRDIPAFFLDRDWKGESGH